MADMQKGPSEGKHREDPTQVPSLKDQLIGRPPTLLERLGGPFHRIAAAVGRLSHADGQGSPELEATRRGGAFTTGTDHLSPLQQQLFNYPGVARRLWDGLVDSAREVVSGLTGATRGRIQADLDASLAKATASFPSTESLRDEFQAFVEAAKRRQPR